MDFLSFSGVRVDNDGTGIGCTPSSTTISSTPFNGSSIQGIDVGLSGSKPLGTKRRAEASSTEAKKSEIEDSDNNAAITHRADENLFIAQYLEQLLCQPQTGSQHDHVASPVTDLSKDAHSRTNSSPFAIELQRDSFHRQQQDTAMNDLDLTHAADDLFDACIDFTIDAEGLVSLTWQDNAECPQASQSITTSGTLCASI